jgi:uncharacterized protein (DUF302 family)
MSYYIATVVDMDFDVAVDRVKEELSRQGMGILTEIDVRETLKAKLDVEFRPYIILGACDPSSAYRALQEERMVGTMLPCNVILQEHAPGRIEVAAVDPVASMASVDNPLLSDLAEDVRAKLEAVIKTLS